MSLDQEHIKRLICLIDSTVKQRKGYPCKELSLSTMSLAGMRCLVTGAGGFLGERIVCQLLEEDSLAEVRGLDKAVSSEALQNFGKVKTKTLLTLMQGDIRDEALLQKAVQDITLVIHAACILDPMGAVDTHTLWDVNVRGTQLLLDTCLHNDVPYFIYTSSLEVTGPNTRGDPIYDGDEDTVYQNTKGFLYAESKKEAEKCVLAMNNQVLKDGKSFVTCSLRPMYIYGEGSPFLLQHLDESIRNNNVFLRLSRKEALVNPVYVGNAAWAHIQMAKAMVDPQKVKQVQGCFYYISDDTPHLSYSDLNYELTKELGFRIESRLPMPLMMLYCYALLLETIRFLLQPFVRYVPHINHHLLTLLNTPFSFSYRKAQRDFGYVPRYKWKEAKQHTSQWYAEVIPQRTAFLKGNH
ncbi:3 beta-hydroxysteroid dehydrogenase/Delta 5--_4-isomerase-like isoform X2 [Varanus komodoensis]|uniref:3 beta-hydroxysteroid dehydrogenase/Delta 5-->4-isomerase-like isoform X2 n=1 Tax=Varanus komodoensis TaxID=61221 RepID=UPI001CF7B0A4|nr:3 beta-hydroxysteroid dehydrogenase/Delta 5-->4-isomerase-like isoform X2 [Varanus komodoensis]